MFHWKTGSGNPSDNHRQPHKFQTLTCLTVVYVCLLNIKVFLNNYYPHRLITKCYFMCSIYLYSHAMHSIKWMNHFLNLIDWKSFWESTNYEFIWLGVSWWWMDGWTDTVPLCTVFRFDTCPRICALLSLVKYNITPSTIVLKKYTYTISYFSYAYFIKVSKCAFVRKYVERVCMMLHVQCMHLIVFDVFLWDFVCENIRRMLIMTPMQ